MQQYNYLRAIYSSFYSSALYRDVKENWGAGVVVYLLLILVISWIISFVQIQRSIKLHYTQFAAEIVPQMPLITIKKGEASTPEPHPYIIRDLHTGENVMTIDTTGQYLNLDQAKSQILVTKHEVIMKDNATVRIEKIPANLTMNIVPSKAKEWILKLIDWVWLFLFPFFLIGSFVYRLIQALLYAVIGKLFAVIGGVTVSYSNMIKLAIVALTPVIVLSTLLDLLSVYFHLQWVIYFIISMAYLIFAIRANSMHK